MRYINTKTGAVIDSPCEISGGDWVAEGDLVDIPVEVEETFDEEEELEEVDETVDFTAFTIAELRDYAEEHGIDLGDAKKKDDIVAVLSSTK